MQPTNSKIIHNLNEFLERASKELTDDELYQEVIRDPSPQFFNQINQIKLMQARTIAGRKKNRFQQALQKLNILQDDPIFLGSLSMNHRSGLVALHRKLKSVTDGDATQLSLDEKILDILDELEKYDI